MKRRQFIKGASYSAGGIGAVSLVTACKEKVMPNIQTPNASNQLRLDRQLVDTHGSYLISYPDGDYPIAVSKLADGHYSACLMDCTHQHCETSISDTGFICPCHGAKYDKAGKVKKGPATQNLKAFTTELAGNSIIVQL